MPTLTPEFVERMEDVLTLYAKPYDPKEPVLCFDEKSKQLIADTRATQPAAAGKPRRWDYEYQRHGTRNIFVTVEPRAGYRDVAVTARRKKSDFANEIKRIMALPRYEQAATIHLVLDNLNTHFEKSLRETLEPADAEAMLSKVKFHHTPKHASWLNMAEIEIGILSRQSIRGRIPDEGALISKIAVWQAERNQTKSTIEWRFTVDDARGKFKYEKRMNPNELC